MWPTGQMREILGTVNSNICLCVAFVDVSQKLPHSPVRIIVYDETHRKISISSRAKKQTTETQPVISFKTRNVPICRTQCVCVLSEIVTYWVPHLYANGLFHQQGEAPHPVNV